MKCLKCPAWGIDNFGFHGCLIKNSIRGDNYLDYHCNKHRKNILKAAEDVKQNEPRSKHYKWKHKGCTKEKRADKRVILSGGICYADVNNWSRLL